MGRKPQQQRVCDEVPKSWAPGAPFLDLGTYWGTFWGTYFVCQNGMRDKEKGQK